MIKLDLLKFFRRSNLQRVGNVKRNVKHFSAVSEISKKAQSEKLQIDNAYIFDKYKLKDLNYSNLKIITTYDEYFKTIIQNEYFKDYSEVTDEQLLALGDKRKMENAKIQKGLSEDLKRRNDAIHSMQTELEYKESNVAEIDTEKNIIVSNDLQVVFFGSYENNISLVLFERFKDIIEKNKKLHFYFIDVNVCPQCAYNCQVHFVPSIILIYKNHLYRKKIEFDYEKPVNEPYLNDFIEKIQRSIDIFHSFNNKFVYSLEKQSNYLNTKYIDVDNQNIHKQNWNTY